MFGIFKKKRKEKKKVEKTTEIKSDWAFYSCKVEDKPASIRLNLALKYIAPIEKYSNRIWFSIQLLNPNENGLTSNEEFPMICKIEDDISAALEKMGMVAVGTLKTDGMFDMYFYAKDFENFEEIIHKEMNQYPDYKYATESKVDKEWNVYFDFLYPGEYEYQSILNQRVLISLDENGDNAEHERDVDHYLDFKTVENRDNFILEVKNIGYKVLSRDTRDEGEYLYSLSISKVSNVLWNTIHDNVWELVVLSKENNGIYNGWESPIV